MTIYTITGGAGFIGSHLADALLAAGHRVRVLDDFSTGSPANLDPRCEVIRGDVADPQIVRDTMQGSAGVFHLAAIASVARSNEDWLETHRVNQTGTLVVLDTARALGQIPVVYASSAAVYGDIGTQSASEDMRPGPLTAYGADKLGSELHAQVAFAVHGVPTLGMRFFNVYGPRQDPLSPYSGVISIFARLAANGSIMTIDGDGQQTRDFIYVGDVVAHLKAAMLHLHDTGGTAVLNVCTGHGTSVLELARLLNGLHGTSIPSMAHRSARPGDIRHSIGNPAKATALLGLSAAVALRDGLARTKQATSIPLALAVGR